MTLAHRLTAALVFALSLPAAAHADWGSSADSMGVGDRVGETFAWTCPPGGTPGTVWGSGLYTSDSSVCTAAVHSGHISLATGGDIAVSILRGSAEYPGSAINGVTSLDYGAWSRSFQITGASAMAAPTSTVETIDWRRTLDDFGIQGDVGRAFTVRCPGQGGLSATIWGTGPFTSDSAICVAAVYAGRITPQTGGEVSFVTTGPRDQYSGGAKNDVTANSFGSWPFGYQIQ